MELIKYHHHQAAGLSKQGVGVQKTQPRFMFDHKSLNLNTKSKNNAVRPVIKLYANQIRVPGVIQK